ncbi:S-adenosyl-L-methionine-dependent methyltransferase [Corynespora cassiicola Philippines]|uniref:DNA (cytosine-5-)-methyltransferase n=1 Tax=Corynespora cassiicola Philippines TaxID=1448308 RepID=A0A2T2NEW5_CORCC|nr:S-adenosyl-L-methionine-dependent methyltransferase [Corynespora cassiicola Philippines]
MCRAKYLGPIFEWKLNEIAIVLNVREDVHQTNGTDMVSPFIQGLEDVDLDEAVKARDCILTNKPYPFLSFRKTNPSTYHRQMTKDECRKDIFHNGRLVCRAVNILIKDSNMRAKPYAGVVRRLYSHEADQLPIQHAHSNSVIVLDEDEKTQNALKRRTKSESLEILEDLPQFRRTPRRIRKQQYTFGDTFCGAGGASQGAVQAGLHVTWGLDHDHHAIQAYGYNHTGADVYLRDAHDFPPEGTPKLILKVDILHLSPPCCYWSPAHTRDGQNDQANYEAIYTVGPILKKVKPRIATLEQTFGLMTHAQHKQNFHLLINDIINAGYDLRYKLQDMSRFGLPQQRKRLLIIAARRGTPLPPFPKPTHGLGLNPFVSVADALVPLHKAPDDEYHMPQSMRVLNKEPYDPTKTFLKGCITTGGGGNYHPSGRRNFTAREYALLQSFPYNYEFSGCNGEALKQIGNAFPPIMAEALYRTIAQHLEAFDHGLIGAEEEIADLQDHLSKQGIDLPGSQSHPISLFDGPMESELDKSPYRYLTRGTGVLSPNQGRRRTHQQQQQKSCFGRKDAFKADPAGAEKNMRRVNPKTEDKSIKPKSQHGDADAAMVFPSYAWLFGSPTPTTSRAPLQRTSPVPVPVPVPVSDYRARRLERKRKFKELEDALDRGDVVELD